MTKRPVDDGGRYGEHMLRQGLPVDVELDRLLHPIRPNISHKHCYISAVITGEDPTETSHLLPLKQLIDGMDADIASLYPAQGAGAVSTRFSMVLVRLKYRGPLTIRDLAAQGGVTHSAMSQTVAAMKKDGLIESSPGTDARTRLVQLTDAGLVLVPFLEAEWRATEAAWAELEEEIPYALAQIVDDLNSALARRSFRDRLLGHLDPRFRS